MTQFRYTQIAEKSEMILDQNEAREKLAQAYSLTSFDIYRLIAQLCRFASKH